MHRSRQLCTKTDCAHRCGSTNGEPGAKRSVATASHGTPQTRRTDTAVECYSTCNSRTDEHGRRVLFKLDPVAPLPFAHGSAFVDPHRGRLKSLFVQSSSRPIRQVVQLSLLLLLAFTLAPAVAAQEGRLIRETVHGKSLEKTVTGESPDRRVSIYLPPSYDKTPPRRYPVVYLLHGIADTDETWIFEWSQKGDPWGTVPGVMNKAISEGRFGEMIVVMPDQKTKFGGSFYTNSTVTGNWEDFTVQDLVSHVDGKYRTIARASGRGIAGHSMGGYGAITIGMKHPETFSVVYALNPAVLGWSRDLSIENPAFRNVLKIKTPEEALSHGFYTLGVIVVGQAFSPNPTRPPFFFDPPFAVSDGKLRPSEPGFNKWQERLPVNMVDTYRANLLKLRGLRFDSGYEDEFLHIPPTARALSTELTARGIDHIFEEYNGDHRNRLWGRTGRLATELFPYFWLLLESEK